MKSVLIALALTLSSAAMAKTPATEALSNLLPTGEYVGTNGAQSCVVKITIKENSAVVIINSGKSSSGYVVVNASLNYSVDEATQAISATQSLKAPHYLNGGTMILSVRPATDSIAFSIATIALDHRGNDYSSYNACTVLR